MRKMSKKGFTLIELLAVIVIMGILMAVAIPSISLVITESRKDIYINSVLTFINEAEKEVLDSTFEIDDPDTTYYIHIANLVDDRTNLGKSGFATWGDAYVVTAMDLINDKVNLSYYFNGADIAGWKIALQEKTKLKKTDVFQDSKKTVDYRPIGKRSKIVVYDENGNKDISKMPYTEMSRTEAKKCYSFQDLNATTTRLTWYNPNCGTDIIIPNRIENRTVIEIYSDTFKNMGITSVRIPETVKTIGARAFQDNKLKTVTIPSSVTRIDSQAFTNNEINKLTLPTTLQTIGANAFKKNQLTGTIESLVPGANTKIGNCAFCDNKLDSAFFMYQRNSDGSYDYSTIIGYIGDLSEFPNQTLILPPEKENIPLKTIGTAAFQSLSAKNWKVVIPDTVTKISDYAFQHAGIAEVNLPSNLKYIGTYAFYNNRLQKLNIPSSVTHISALAFNVNYVTSGDIWIYERTESGINYQKLIGYSGANRNNIIIPSEKNGVKLTTLGASTFKFLSLTGTLTLPEKIIFEGNDMFNLNRLTSIDNGDGVLTEGFVYGRKSDGSIDKTYLYGYARSGAQNVQIPSTIKTIGPFSFYYTDTRSVIIPEGVEEIGEYAFCTCQLKDITIPSTMKTIGRMSFYKTSTNNKDFATIVNKTGKSFDWKAITGGPSAATFETGVVENWYGDITVTNE